MKMPQNWHDGLGHGEFVGHLGFGVQEDDVQSPVPGHSYA